jgi:hypothetical protein
MPKQQRRYVIYLLSHCNVASYNISCNASLYMNTEQTKQIFIIHIMQTSTVLVLLFVILVDGQKPRFSDCKSGPLSSFLVLVYHNITGGQNVCMVSPSHLGLYSVVTSLQLLHFPLSLISGLHLICLLSIVSPVLSLPKHALSITKADQVSTFLHQISTSLAIHVGVAVKRPQAKIHFLHPNMFTP